MLKYLYNFLFKLCSYAQFLCLLYQKSYFVEFDMSHPSIYYENSIRWWQGNGLPLDKLPGSGVRYTVRNLAGEEMPESWIVLIIACCVIGIYLEDSPMISYNIWQFDMIVLSAENEISTNFN